MTDRVWILGAPDPEMEAIETLLRECGERVEYAIDDRGQRVSPATAYRCPPLKVPAGSTVYAVECIDVLPEGVVRIDHHRPGDPGYGRPPAEFMAASSIGQVIAELTRLGKLPAQEPEAFVLVAAADHCLGAAYRGECPGVDPDALMRWRAESRAHVQGRDAGQLLAEVEAATPARRDAFACATLLLVEPGPGCGDPPSSCHLDAVPPGARMRREPPWPELGEASCRTGIGYVAGPLRSPDGRRKITCGGTPEQIRAFLEHWAPRQGLVDCYGDPARGFAGGYLPSRCHHGRAAGVILRPRAHERSGAAR